MDWVFDHIQVLIAAAGVVAYWLNQRRQAQTGEEAPPKETTFEDPQLAERTRKIREEIQRKIEQRARGYANEQPTRPRSAQPAEPPPVIVREVVARPQPAMLRRAASHQEAQRMAEILEQQASLAEQLRQAQEMKAAAARRAEFETQISSNKEEIAAAVTRGALGDDIRNPAALRRAFILREILGPPVALRQ